MMRRLLANLIATVTRIVLIFAALAVIWDAGARLFVQVAPPGLWFAFTRVVILPSGDVAIAYRQSFSGDLPVNIIAELIGDEGSQPCAASGRRLIEADTTFAVLPISRTLPGCDFARLPDGRFFMEITASYPAIGAYDKSITVRSDNAIVVEDGRIVGATPAPIEEDG
ncbi:hypothetical protein VSX64_14605 [Aurantimonas sp. C2-6-R+9]|uniref:hypothetical protein n=1 Tax=unclassified Aurantimonas TaxID=2638230 RepID=UPI002E194020|nr:MULTISPECIES: hypothetical protein [unclassified Aurantimonas]MEC5291987.1 hypothetical protein [Aurantimonas sp. C2-3-R2]MEC5382099.1 hypothetical protein [Aurantimonas sp. C2-6-R+9]MEC5413072.1 hypothetical protein [Aurantimonas sp. C2-4-R8]